MGLAKTGGIASNGSGDFVIAFSTNDSVRVDHQPAGPVVVVPNLQNDNMSPIFMAAIEATEEAIVNSLLMAETMKGWQGHEIGALPRGRLVEILRKYNRIFTGPSGTSR
jgi:D-aminopeptidase